jgi:hypothetical protein
MGHDTIACRILKGKSEGKRPLGRIDVGGKISEKWNLKKRNAVIWTRLI